MDGGPRRGQRRAAVRSGPQYINEPPPPPTRIRPRRGPASVRGRAFALLGHPGTPRGAAGGAGGGAPHAPGAYCPALVAAALPGSPEAVMLLRPRRVLRMP